MTTIRALIALIAALLGALVAAPIVALGLPFLGVALLTRIIQSRLESKVVPWDELIEFCPIVGWKPKANLDIYCLANGADVFHSKTDADGWPGRVTVTESQVVVFGDSFAFGFAIDNKAFFAELNPKLRVKAIGAPGYNMVQQLLLMKELSSQLRGKLVIWFVYVGNDLYDNLSPEMNSYRTPFLREGNGRGTWEIVTSHVSPGKWSYNFNRDSGILHLGNLHQRLGAVFGTTYLAGRAYSACEFLMEKANELCDEAGARLVVMTIPWALQLDKRRWADRYSRGVNGEILDSDLPDKMIGAMCDKLGVGFVAGKDYLQVSDYILGEGHWNETGHRRVAKAVEGLYRDYVRSRCWPEGENRNGMVFWGSKAER